MRYSVVPYAFGEPKSERWAIIDATTDAIAVRKYGYKPPVKLVYVTRHKADKFCAALNAEEDLICDR